MKIGIVAGEKSGDYLGAELIKAFKQHYPDAQFVGLCGPMMQQQGGQTLAEMEKISIMGLTGALKGLFDILSIRRTIKNYMLDWQPDVFIGIDVPDFNLGLEIKLKRAGIPTVHYVSPTVWAWRSKRIVKIKRAVNLMLVLFPFEEAFYHKHNTSVKYVGHPLARSILNWQVSDTVRSKLLSSDIDDSELLSRTQVNSGAPINGVNKMVAILPGSRMSEVSRLAPIMLEACIDLVKQYPDVGFVVPAANPKLFNYLQSLIEVRQVPIKLVLGQSRDVLALCHIAVVASGTAALEAALFAKPMVVMYKVAKLEEWYAARTMVVKHFSMPNHLTEQPMVRELIQESATVENLVEEVERLLVDPQYYKTIQNSLAEIAPQLDEDSGQLALDAIKLLLRDRKIDLVAGADS